VSLVSRRHSAPSVAVVGAGVIGLSVAWGLAESGCAVDLYDEQPGQGASHAAAGMLAPASETVYGEDALLALGLSSALLWPDFAARLSQSSGIDVRLRQQGSLLVGHDADDAAALRRVAEHLSRHGLAAESLSGRQARALEPALSPQTRAALLLPADDSVDNRRVVEALLVAAEHAGVRLHRRRVSVAVSELGAVGVSSPTAEGTCGTVERADQVVLAAGAGSADVQGLPRWAVPAVRPVKGQILRLRGGHGLLTHTLRATVAGVPVYLVPRGDGGIVLGATSEDVGADVRVTAGGVHEMLRAAIAVVPEVAELELVETLARLRPTTPDNGPLIGPSPLPGLLLATGHYRGGMLLAPATARALTDLVHGRAVMPVVRPFHPHRFDTGAVHPLEVTA